MRFGISARFDPVCTTYADMERITTELRRFGVDDEGGDFSVYYEGVMDIDNLLGEQAKEVIKTLNSAQPKIAVTYVCVFSKSDFSDVDETSIYEEATGNGNALDNLTAYLQNIPANQTRLEDFNE